MHRSAFDRRVHHARHARILSEHAAAIDDVGQVGDGDILADVAVIGGGFVLQSGHSGDRQLRGRGGQIAVAQLAAGRGVHHFMILRLHFGHGNAPLRGRGLLEHRARGGAGLPHGLVETTDGVRPVGILIAVFSVADRLLNLDAIPVGVEFIGNHHGESRANAGAHFRAVRDDDHRAVGLDAEVDAWMPGGLIRHRLSSDSNLRSQHECARGEHVAEEAAAADLAYGHAFTPAAILIAEQMRW